MVLSCGGQSGRWRCCHAGSVVADLGDQGTVVVLDQCELSAAAAVSYRVAGRFGYGEGEVMPTLGVQADAMGCPYNKLSQPAQIARHEGLSDQDHGFIIVDGPVRAGPPS